LSTKHLREDRRIKSGDDGGGKIVESSPKMTALFESAPLHLLKKCEPAAHHGAFAEFRAVGFARRF
jgi:hypothetical protein